MANSRSRSSVPLAAAMVQPHGSKVRLARTERASSIQPSGTRPSVNTLTWKGSRPSARSASRACP